MIPQAVEYSLRAMALLSQHPGQALTVRAIATRGQVPRPYLSKLLQGLARAGLVRSQRGIGGGYTLTRDPATITLADVVHVIEPLKRITRCPLGIVGHTTLCSLHRKLDQALATVEQAFCETTLADLFKESGVPSPLCDPQSPPTFMPLTAILPFAPARSSKAP